MIAIFINDQIIRLPTGATVAAALEQQRISDTKGIAVAVNNQVVPGVSWQSYTLKDKDSILVIKAAQGG